MPSLMAECIRIREEMPEFQMLPYVVSILCIPPSSTKWLLGEWASIPYITCPTPVPNSFQTGNIIKSKEKTLRVLDVSYTIL